GKGVLKAVENVSSVIAPELLGMAAEGQAAIDGRMIELDGSAGKSRLGANAILAVSCAVARAAAAARGIPLWRHLAADRVPSLPVPMINILSGGHHAGFGIEFQYFLVVPQGFARLADALEAVVAVHRATRAVLDERGLSVTGLADEGGWGPRLRSNEQALDILSTGVERAGSPMAFAIDVAATH